MVKRRVCVALFIGLCTMVQSHVCASGRLYVTDWALDRVLLFDATEGDYLGEFITPGLGGLDNPADIAIGPDGHLYVSSGANSRILKYDRLSGDFLGTFAVNAGTPIGLTFHDDLLYVASRRDNSIKRYDGHTGIFIDEVVGSNDVLFWPYDVISTADDKLLVSAFSKRNLVEFTTSPFGINEVLASNSAISTGLAIGPGGRIFSANWNQDISVMNRDGTSITLFANEPTLNRANFLAFGLEGDLYVTDERGPGIYRFDGTSGALIEVLSGPTDGNWIGSSGLLFDTVPECSVLTMLVLSSPAVLLRHRQLKR